MRRLARLLPYLAILCLVLIAGFVLLQSGPLAEHLRRGVVAELRRQTGREVDVGRVSVSLTGRAVLHDLVVRAKDGSPFLTCPVATVRVAKPGGWLSQSSGPLEVRDVKLVGPQVVVSRSEGGEWSFSDLLARRPTARPFRGNVTLENGRLTLVDHARSTGSGQARGGLTTVADEVEVVTRHEGADETWFRVRGSGTEGAWDRLEVEGRSSPSKGVQVSGRVSNLDLAYAMERLIETNAVTIAAGRGEVTGEVTVSPARSASSGQAHSTGSGQAAVPAERVQYRVEVTAAGAEVAFPWLRRPVKSVEGKATFENGDLKLEQVNGKVAEAPVAVNGTITGLGRPGQVALGLDIDANGIRAHQVAALLPKVYIPPVLLLPAPVRITARAEGPAQEVVVSGRATVRVIKFHLVPWRDVVAKFRYEKGALAITGMSAHGSPRRLEADLSLAWGKGKRNAAPFGGLRAGATVHLKAVPVETLAQMAGVQVTGLQGIASVDADLSFTQATQEVRGEVVIEEAEFRGLRLGRVAAQFRLTGKSLSVLRGRIEGPLARGSFSGEVSLPDRYRAKANLGSVDLEALGQALGVPSLRGGGPAEVEVTGALGRPAATGRIRLGPGKLWEVGFDQASAAFEVTQERMRVRDLQVKQGEGKLEGEAEVTGWQGGNAAARLSGSATLAGLDARPLAPTGLAEWLPKGTIGGTIALSGTRAEPKVKADLDLGVALVSGLPLNMGQAHVRYEGGKVLVDAAALAGGRSQVRMTGEYAPSTGLALEVAADPVDLGSALAGARTSYGMAISGEAALKATITGPLSDPRVAVNASSTTLVVNDIKVDEVVFVGTLSGGLKQVHIDQALVKQGESKIEASGEVGWGSGPLDLTCGLRKVDLGVVQRIANTAAWRLEQSGRKVPHRQVYTTVPTPLGGLLTADVRLTANRQGPKLEVRGLKVEGLDFAGPRVEHVEGDLVLSRAEAKFSLRAVHEAVHASVEGDVRPGGEVSVTADIGNLDLRLLEPWLRGAVAGAPSAGTMGGEADINFDVTGTTDELKLVGDILVRGLRIGPLALEAATTGRMTLDAQGVLRLDEIRLVKGAMEATGSATIPIRFPWWQQEEVGKPEAELSIKNATIPIRFPWWQQEKVGAPAADASVAPMPEARPAILNADLALQNGQMVVGRLSEGGEVESPGIHGTLGDGSFGIAGEMSISSYSPARWGENEFHFAAELNGAQVEVPGLLKGKVDGKLYLAREGGRTVLKTKEAPLVLSHATVTIPKGPLTFPSAAPLGKPPEVKVRVVTGDEVWLAAGSRERPTQIKISPRVGPPGTETSGYLELSGVASAAGLEAHGEFESQYGVLAFPNGTLTLRSGRAWLDREAGQRLRVTVSAEADGRVQDYYVSISPAGQVYPPVSEDPSAQFRLDAASSPPLEEAYITALLVGPLATPTPGGGSDLPSLLAGAGREEAVGGQVTGLRVAPLSGALGLHELSLDFDLRGPVHMRVGERIMRRFMVSYISAVSGAPQSQTMRVTYEVNPRIFLGWSVDELGRGRWEVQSFRLF
jgi:hypothetical protein